MVSFQSWRTSCFCDEFPPVTFVYLMAAFTVTDCPDLCCHSSAWKVSLTWWFWSANSCLSRRTIMSSRRTLHDSPESKANADFCLWSGWVAGTRSPFHLKQQQQQERQSIWNSGFQDTRQQAGKDSELWAMENRWGAPYPCLSLLPGDSSPMCAGSRGQAESSGLRIEQLGNQGEDSSQSSQDRISGRGDLRRERTSEICWGPLEYSGGSQFVCAMKLPKSREITLQRVRGNTAQPTGRARNTACSYKSDLKTCDSWPLAVHFSSWSQH